MIGCKCPICGKLFFPTPGWVYKLGSVKGQKIYCSYKCYRVDQKKKEEKSDERRKKKYGIY